MGQLACKAGERNGGRTQHYSSPDKQTSFLAVYDWHGGSEVTLYCQNNLPSRLKECSYFKSGDVVCALHEVFQGLDAEVRTTPAIQEMTALLDITETLNKITFQSGTTATVCVLNNSSITAANICDSRCVLSRLGRAYPLSYDHKPTDEREHFLIVQGGGMVVNSRIYPWVALNMSSSIRDHAYTDNLDLPPQEQVIASYPDVQTTPLIKWHRFIVLACDGIFEVMSGQQVVDFIKQNLDEKSDKQNIDVQGVIAICQAIL